MVQNKMKYFMLWLFDSVFDLLEPWIDKDEESFNQLFAKVICNNLNEIATPWAPVGAKKYAMTFNIPWLLPC